MKFVKPKEPKLSALILTASSGICCGFALAAYLLFITPVDVVSKTPSEEVLSKPGEYRAFYKPGRVGGSESRNLETAIKRIKRRTPGPVTLDESEINYLFEQFGKAADSGKESEKAAPQGTRVEDLKTRFEGERMFVGMKLVSQSGGSRTNHLLQAELGFSNGEAGPFLTVKSVTINSLPLPMLGGVVGSMIRSKVEEIEWPAEYVEMWNNIREIRVESGSLVLEVGLRRA